MAAKWLKTRQTKYSAYIAVYILVILAILAAVNFLANRYDKSYDSHHEQAVQPLRPDHQGRQGPEARHPLTYFGDERQLPERARPAGPLLGRFRRSCTSEYIDPEKKPQLAKAAGFRPDSPVVVQNGARNEGAKSLTEEEVTGALIRSLKSGERNVCFLTGAGEHSHRRSGSRAAFQTQGAAGTRQLQVAGSFAQAGHGAGCRQETGDRPDRAGRAS